jgi:hypothetical protein
MIQLPRRSVTRFFIPLIDVLTLLFCIFLLMPLIKATGEGQDTPGQPPQPGPTLNEGPEQKSSSEKGEFDRAERERMRKERQELEQIRQEKIETLQRRLFIRVLEIDADTGKLFADDAGQRLEIRNQDEALRLIAHHRQEAGSRELYYLFLFPRRITGFPEERQIRQYENWFKGVAHGMDNPRPTPEGNKP